MARAILLDVDGTLVDTNDLHARAWREVLAEHGYEVPFERLRALIGKGGDKLLPEVTGLAADAPEAEALAKQRTELFMGRDLPQVRPFAQVRPLLERFTRDGYRLAVASSATDAELEGLLERAGIADLIETSTTSDDAEHSKPDPDIVTAALAKLGIDASAAIMLGDTPYDVEAATRAGVTIVALRCGGWNDDGLHGAAAVYDDPADLLARYSDSLFGVRP